MINYVYYPSDPNEHQTFSIELTERTEMNMTPSLKNLGKKTERNSKRKSYITWLWKKSAS